MTRPFTTPREQRRQRGVRGDADAGRAAQALRRQGQGRLSRLTGRDVPITKNKTRVSHESQKCANYLVIGYCDYLGSIVVRQ